MIHLQRALLDGSSLAPAPRLAALKHKLQTAIELEHSTIPPYLYALYSIKNGCNIEVASLIRSIVVQEMLHMSLDCNVLNAIGGQPKIDNPRFIPSYPGHLPGGVEGSLVVPLAPLSKQLVHDVFMVIEEPDQTVDGTSPPPDGITIGEFYTHIKNEIVALGHNGTTNIFTGDPSRQLVTGFPELQNQGVTDQASALAAIDLIISQGEGSPTSPLDSENELAHYYKYAEIYQGRKLIHNPDPNASVPWVFLGHPIAFDPAGVYPVISNPSQAGYAGHPRLQDLNNTFNAAYTELLRKLHRVFNGEPDWLGPALLTMQALKAQAQLLMTQPVVPGQTAGPSFQYMGGHR